MNDGLNRVILLGNLGADAELRYTGAGTPVLSFRLATHESFLDRNKEQQERTDWHSVIVWGARAEGLSKILGKGMGVLVEGGLRTSSYDKNGEKRYRTEVHAREICLLGRRNGAAPPQEPEDESGARQMPAPPPPPPPPPPPQPQPQLVARQPVASRSGTARAMVLAEALEEQMPY